MSSLLSALNQAIEKYNLGKQFEPPTFRTGIDVLDYRNGRFSFDSLGREVLKIGYDHGKIIMIVGPTSSGKTTLGVQMSGNIIKDITDAFVQHQDFERSTTVERLMGLVGYTSLAEFKKKYVHLNSDISLESTFELVKRLTKLKKTGSIENKKKRKSSSDEEETEETTTTKGKNDVSPFLVPNPFNPSETMLVPTPLIIDSLTSMRTRETEDDLDMASNMSAAAAAKRNTEFFNALIGDFLDASITPIIINHLSTKININAFAPSGPIIKYLKQDDAIPGGKRALLLTNTLWKIEPGASLSAEDGLGINGFYSNLTLIKSRTNVAGNKCKLIYDPVNGFNNLLTNYILLKDNNKIGGAGRGYFLKGHDDMKFSQKDLQDKYYSMDKFKKAFDEITEQVLLSLVPKPESFVDFDSEIEKSISDFESMKKKLKLEQVEFEEFEGIYWWDKKTDTYYDNDGDVVDFSDVEEE